MRQNYKNKLVHTIRLTGYPYFNVAPIPGTAFYFQFPVKGFHPVDHIGNTNTLSFAFRVKAFSIIANQNTEKSVSCIQPDSDLSSFGMLKYITDLLLDNAVNI